MAASDGKLRALLITFFPMFIATLSLLTSIFNGYLNLKFLDFIQRNTSRVEYMRTCKEIIDAYFQVKVRAGIVHANAPNGAADAAMSKDEIDAVSAVNKFAALATYLANLRNDFVRKQYTDLTTELGRIVAESKRSPADVTAAFASADHMFSNLNNDCVRSAQDAM
jgi:hypothetical protein